ncbi:unnamed protein product [Cylindrotheca closterium]|uniref:Helicase-associated domain-containing protein n=1 Tax=Cylindrotheca closterium TaxID=2856 RepID=A0AAD2CVN9_9STRA|nr:unnamed protein product [Cylindrotheca closterium]
MLAESSTKRIPHRCPSSQVLLSAAANKASSSRRTTQTKSLGEPTGLFNLISMSLVTGNDTSQLFETSTNNPGQQLDLLDDLLASGFCDPYPQDGAATTTTTATSDTDNALAVARPQEPSARPTRTGSFDYMFDAALEPTPLGPRWSETSSSASPSLATTPNLMPMPAPVEGALERLLSQEFHLGDNSTAPVSEATTPMAAATTTTPKRAHPEGQITSSSSFPAPKKKQRCINHKAAEEGPKFRDYQEQQWIDKFQELIQFKASHGHCLVPHTFDENPALSRWVKRQRYQYKMFLKLNQHDSAATSTMTEGRVRMLENIGFVWDSHAVAWEERLLELKEFQSRFGHCNVPSNYTKSPPLAVWVKRQRRQVKLFWKGERSTITQERFVALRDLGFTWELRRSKNSC